MDRWPAWLLCLLVTSSSTQRIRLPTVANEKGTCTTRSGVPGSCVDIRFCSSTSRSLQSNTQATCGFNDTFPVVCCAVSADSRAEAIEDISPPKIDFKCGKNTPKLLRLKEVSPGPERFLRPENVIEFPEKNAGSPGEPVTRAGFSTGEVAVTIVGGVVVLKNSWPWMALVGELDAGDIRWFCGGVLINRQWVLTAFHCFFRHTPDVVRLGEHDYNDDNDDAAHQDIRVAETVGYPDFTSPEAYHDLALLRLASPVTIQKFISPVCLPWGSKSDTELSGLQATLAGWGDTLFGGYPSSILQEVAVTVFPPSKCDSSYSNLPHFQYTWPKGIGEETLCAGDLNGGRDACQGDSGGPIMSQDSLGYYVLAGIVSQGFGCGHKDYPGLYANVRYPPYLAWIKKVAFS